MGISSLGVGSSILTQDVLDQLRTADEAKFVTPIETSISENNSKSTAFDEMDAYMDNAYESLKSLTEYGVFEGRTTNVDDEDIVGVTASESSDIQDFTLEVTALATKEVEQSGGFTARTDTIATDSGTMELNVGDKVFPIDYTAETTLEDLKELIDKEAGDSVSTTIVQVGDGDFRLIFSAVDTGTGQEISIKDLSIKDYNNISDESKDKGRGGSGGNNDSNVRGNLSTSLTTSMSNIQEAVDAEFKYNGLEITRSSNTVEDLLSGVKITLKDLGTTNVSVEQDRGSIEEKITNFVDNYNSAIYHLEEVTKSSTEEDERGVFSSDNTVKNMKNVLKNIVSTVGGDAGRMSDFGIELDDDGRLSLDSTVLNDTLDEDPDSVHAYFIGGTYTKADTYTTVDGVTTMTEQGYTTKVTGAFTELEDAFAKYSKGSSILDQYQDSIETRLDSLNEQKEKAVERLNSSYAIMQKKFAAYDAIISAFNTASDMFTQMIETEIASS